MHNIMIRGGVQAVAGMWAYITVLCNTRGPCQRSPFNIYFVNHSIYIDMI